MDGRAMLAGTNSSVGAPAAAGVKGEPEEGGGRGEEEEVNGRFSSKELPWSVAKSVSPGPWGGSSRGAGMRWRAPNPSTHPRAPSPPQPREGVMVSGRVTLYSWL